MSFIFAQPSLHFRLSPPLSLLLSPSYHLLFPFKAPFFSVTWTVFINCLGNHIFLNSPVKLQLWRNKVIYILCSDSSATGWLSSVWLKHTTLPMRASPQIDPAWALDRSSLLFAWIPIPNVHLDLQNPYSVPVPFSLSRWTFFLLKWEYWGF